jgi:hypothetical protein
VLDKYKTYLTAQPVSSDRDIKEFQSALFCVLFREEGVNIDTVGRLACPVQLYMALLALRKAGDFVKPGLVTQPISRLLYLSRGAVLKVALSSPDNIAGFIP